MHYSRDEQRREVGCGDGRMQWHVHHGLLALFVALALLHTWPLVTAPATLSRTDTADTLLNQWILGWVAHALATAPLQLFNANIFFPEPRTLAFSEHLFVPALFGAPLFWAGASPVLAYNVVLWAGLALTGWTTSLVLHRWTGDWWAALFGGCLAAFNTETLTRMGHIQAMHVEFLPLALLALDDVLRDGRRRDGLRLGLYAALQMLCSGYLLVMTALSLLTALLVRPRQWSGPGWRSRAVPLVVALAVTAAICSPFLYQYYRVQHDQGLVRSLDEVRLYSGVWQNFVATGARLHYGTWGARLFADANAPAFPGVVAVALALLGLGSGVAWRDPRARMWLAIGVVGAGLSFGAKVPGYAWLYEALPLLQGIRAVARLSLLALLAVAVLGSFGLAWLRARLRSRHRHRLALAAGLIAVVMVNVENTRAPMAFVEFEGIPPIYARLASETDAVVVELPFPEPARVAANAAAVLASTHYWKPLLNGYSGYMPASYVRHWEAFRAFPDPSVITALRLAGVTHLVVTVAQAPGAVAALQQVSGVTLFAADQTRRIYRIVPQRRSGDDANVVTDRRTSVP